ncbi:AAA-ATPase [Rhodococcus phage Reynauld]|uniref:AAA-ATPase n=1 Tax=Rhodococcus phage Reynauld TaxID=3062845 RepID=A0ACD4UHL3_9CAUD|nr:AAA-ATPase [Rhodococcus phage Reynauld]
MTCSSCPSLIRAADHPEQNAAFGRATGVDMCNTYGIPLDTLRPMSGSKHDCIDRSGDCPTPGTVGASPRLGEVSLEMLVVEPAGATVTPPVWDSVRRVRSCTGCRWFVPAADMHGRFGLPLDVCSAYGDPIHLPSARWEGHQARAQRCPYNEAASERVARTNVGDVRLRPAYAEKISVLHTFTGIELDDPTPGEPIREPDAVDSARPPTDEERAAGIASWRAVPDPDGIGDDVLLPVFDPARFDDEQRAKIPRTGDPEHPELYRDEHGLLYAVGVLWMHLGETPALNGPPGVGKTEFFRHIAWAMGLPFERYSITASTDVDDLAGKMLLENHETVFQYGRLATAWQRPGVIVIDEPNVGPPEVWQFLRPLTDNSKQLVLDMNKGERVERHPHAFLGMAFNPSYDMRNAGTHEIADADGSRLMHIFVPPPTADVEREILRQACALDGYDIKEETLTAIIGIGADLRGLAEQDAFPIQWGLRQQIKVARSSRWFSLPRCYRLAAGDLFERVYCDKIKAAVLSHVK